MSTVPTAEEAMLDLLDVLAALPAGVVVEGGYNVGRGPWTGAAIYAQGTRVLEMIRRESVAAPSAPIR